MSRGKDLKEGIWSLNSVLGRHPIYNMVHIPMSVVGKHFPLSTILFGRVPTQFIWGGKHICCVREDY